LELPKIFEKQRGHVNYMLGLVHCMANLRQSVAIQPGINVDGEYPRNRSRIVANLTDSVVYLRGFIFAFANG
jgi:hypothetical protein